MCASSRCDWSRNCAWTTESKADVLCRINQDYIFFVCQSPGLQSSCIQALRKQQKGTIAQDKRCVYESIDSSGHYPASWDYCALLGYVVRALAHGETSFRPIFAPTPIALGLYTFGIDDELTSNSRQTYLMQSSITSPAPLVAPVSGRWDCIGPCPFFNPYFLMICSRGSTRHMLILHWIGNNLHLILCACTMV